MWFLVDPHAAALRGRRIRKGCALCRRPRKKNNFEFKFAFELEFDFHLKCEFKLEFAFKLKFA